MSFLPRARFTIVFILLPFSQLFAQEIHKQTSLDFLTLMNNAQYQQAFAMFDTVVKSNVTEYYFETSWQTAMKQLGTMKDYKFNREETSMPYQITYITCNFDLSPLDLKLVFNNNNKIVGFYFVPPSDPKYKYAPPAYDKPELYNEKEILVITGKYRMPGTLILPVGVTKPPVVILVHGSGPSDMDESVGPNKIFRDMAVGLAAQGIATIRYQKRTRIYGRMIVEAPIQATVQDETIDDVISAVKLACQLPDVDSNRIYILGHSLGAMLAPRIAEECPKIKKVIMMAGNARSLLDILPEQMKYLESIDSANIAGENEKAKWDKEITVAKSDDLKPNTPDSLLPFKMDAMYWIDLNHYDQVKTAEGLTVPVLIMQGERDYQVTMTDFNLWKESLSTKPNVEFKSYPKLNHLFIEGVGKSVPAEYKKPGNVPDYVINDLANWINKK
ncbi:MAG TPA: DUF3887 domain-containing protein [Bacteroidia bacterium]|jgi:dienelactone hydrolase|nr:DUF3887 domain-containing protein [Bacteroidia bacterium]